MYIPTAVFASTALAVLALITGALALRGTVLAWTFCIVISCSGGLPAFAAGLYWLTEYRGFMFAYTAVMAESLADSAASKIGPLTDGRTVDICTFRPTQAGISGAVSLSGTLAALMGSMCIGLLLLVSSRCGSAEAALVAVVGFLGCMFDSMLGSHFQVRYRCTCCGKVTERNKHCGIACVKEKGIAWMSNDGVNLLSNVFALVLALDVYGVMN